MPLLTLGQNRAYAVSQLQDLQAKLNKAKSTIPSTRASVPQSSSTKSNGATQADKPASKRKDITDEATANKAKEEQKTESALLKGVRDRYALHSRFVCSLTDINA